MASAFPFPLEARGLTVMLGGHAALDRMSLRLEAGRRTVILGANGAGKSVLLRVLHGLLPATSGEVLWGGSRDRPRAQAMVFQRPVMLRRPALANVEYALGLWSVGGADRRRRALAALESVGLLAIAERPARVLSGGEQQRLALARAWALAPRILFLDEPTASLDPGASTEIENIIDRIHAAGTRIVMTIHNLGQARRLADEIVFLHAGRATELTEADSFFNRPQSQEASTFLKGELPWK